MSTKIAVLKSEGDITHVSHDDLAIRQNLVLQFHKLPAESVLYIRNFMPQIGCPNRCSFCSQSASPVITRIADTSLRNLISALKTVAIEVLAKRARVDVGSFINDDGSLSKSFVLPENGLIGNRIDGGKSKVYSYLDTDICSYPDFYNYVKYLSEDLGVPIQLSTVGYSRHNKQLQEMHEKIVKEFPEAIGGLNFSMTPYTYGWTKEAESTTLYSRQDFIKDMANAIRTYSPLIVTLGVGKELFSVALRFKPEIFVKNEPLDEGYLRGHHFIHSGPHLLFNTKENIGLETARVIGTEGRKSLFNTLPESYILVTSDTQLNTATWHSKVLEIITKYVSNLLEGNENMHIAAVKLYKLENADGIYYAVDPTFDDDGHFRALHFYPQTNKRKVSGYNNAERPFLNTLLNFKKKRGIQRRAEFPNATWADVSSVIEQLKKNVKEISNYDSAHGKHIESDVLPIIESYVEVLRLSGLGPSFFFHPRFTDDTGQIVNRGRGVLHFLGLGSMDTPITPNEERTFGLKKRETNDFGYRLSPDPAKNLTSKKDFLMFVPVDYNPMIWYTNHERTRVIIEGIELQTVSFEQVYSQKLLPGINIGNR